MITREEVECVASIYEWLYDLLNDVLIGQEKAVKIITAALLCSPDSKILLSGPKGSGKTTIAKFLAKNFISERISILPDTMPSEIQRHLKGKENMQFLQVDELNRASSKVLGAFIELFEENQMTITDEGVYRFSPFYVFATQNNKDVTGTFNVSEALYDRFDVTISFKHLSEEAKRYLLFEDYAYNANLLFDPRYIYWTHKIVDKFILSEEDEDVLMEIFSLVDNLTIEEKRVFDGNNIRGEQFAIQMAKLTALANGYTTIIASDIVDYLKPIFMHRLDQLNFPIGSSRVNDAFEELEEDVLKIKRERSR